MAEGDPVIVNGTVGGNTTATVSVPTGEVWLIRSFGNCHRMRLQYASTSGRSWVSMEGENDNEGSSGDLPQRPIYDENNQPSLQNVNCSTKGYYFGGNEL